MNTPKPMSLAPTIEKGVEDKFYYVISDACVKCGKCRAACPVGAIKEKEGKFVIAPTGYTDSIHDYHNKLIAYIETH